MLMKAISLLLNHLHVKVVRQRKIMNDRVYVFGVTSLESVTGKLEISNIELRVLDEDLEELCKIHGMHIMQQDIPVTKRFLVQQAKALISNSSATSA